MLRNGLLQNTRVNYEDDGTIMCFYWTRPGHLVSTYFPGFVFKAYQRQVSMGPTLSSVVYYVGFWTHNLTLTEKG